MKNKNSLTEFSDLANDFQTLQKKIASDERKRERLLKQIEENPSEKLQKQLSRLDESIAEHTQQLPSPAFLHIVTVFDNLGKQMLTMVDKYDDKLLLTMGGDAPHWQILRLLQENRNAMHDSGKENSTELVIGFDSVIVKLTYKIEEKRRRAAERFPELARKHRPPDYEMPEEYNQTVNFITKQIELRDRAMKRIKFATPEERSEVLIYVAEIDRLIDECEEYLAQRYENYQKKQRYLEGMRNHLKQGSQTELKELREHLKKNPTHNGVLERMLREEFPE